METGLLGRELRRRSRGSQTAVLATTPWQWPCVSMAPAGRRLFECADDWAALMPARRMAFVRLYERVAHEADAIAVASEKLASLFPGRDVSVVRNGTSPEVLRAPVAPPPEELRMVYAGTLSDRFDVDLVRQVLTSDGRWRLDLFGQCQYPRGGDRPDGALQALLDELPDHVTWHGPIERARLAEAIDASRVCVLPHRRTVSSCGRRRRRREAGVPGDQPGGSGSPSWRGDAMKLYDYAARGRPVVSTRWTDELIEVGPPHMYLAGTAAEFGDAVNAAIEEPHGYAAERRAWAEQHRWERRWPRWRAVIRGDRPQPDR